MQNPDGQELTKQQMFDFIMTHQELLPEEDIDELIKFQGDPDFVEETYFYVLDIIEGKIDRAPDGPVVFNLAGLLGPGPLVAAQPNPFVGILPQPNLENVDANVNLDALIAKELFVCQHQRKQRHCQLIDISKFEGPCIILTESLANNDICFAAATGYNAYWKFHLNGDEVALSRLNIFCPILKYMKFNRYRVAGGAPLAAVRECNNNFSIGKSDDVDIFVVTGPQDSDLKKSKVGDEIYVAVLREIDEIYKKYFQEEYRVMIIRTNECTTITFTCKKSRFELEEEVDPLNGKPKIMKLQIIHRAYDTESEILLGFDLGPAQVLFDGTTFKCTSLALDTIRSGIIPVDISRASKSFGMRLNKYCSQKQFLLAFPGLNRSKALNVLGPLQTVDKGDYNQILPASEFIRFPCGFRLERNPRNFSEYLIVLKFVIDGETNIETEDLKVASSDYEFTHAGPINEFSQLEGINVRALLKENKVFVTAAATQREIAHSWRVVEISAIEQFITDPICTPLRPTFLEMCSIKNEFKKSDFTRLFGPYAKDAWGYYFDEDEHNYNALVAFRANELEEILKQKFESLKTIIWRIINPNSQDYGSFNPVDLNPRMFYGEYYNGYHCSKDWPAKLTIIMAFKKKDYGCLFTMLPVDVIRLIFRWVDHLHCRELL